MKIEEAIAKFVDYIAVERRMAAGTVRNYEGDLRDLQAFLLPLEVTELDDLSARDIRGWQMEHLGAGEAAGTVRRRKCRICRHCLHQCAQQKSSDGR